MALNEMKARAVLTGFVQEAKDNPDLLRFLTRREVITKIKSFNSEVEAMAEFKKVTEGDKSLAEVKAGMLALGLVADAALDAKLEEKVKAQFLSNQLAKLKVTANALNPPRAGEYKLGNGPPAHTDLDPKLKTKIEEPIDPALLEQKFRDIYDPAKSLDDVKAARIALGYDDKEAEHKAQFLSNQLAKLKVTANALNPPRAGEYKLGNGPPAHTDLDLKLKAKIESPIDPGVLDQKFKDMYDPTKTLVEVGRAREALGYGTDAGENKARFLSNQWAKLKVIARTLMPLHDESEFKLLGEGPPVHTNLDQKLKEKIEEPIDPALLEEKFGEMYAPTTTLENVTAARTALGLVNTGDEDKTQFVKNQVLRLGQVATTLVPLPTADELKALLGEPPDHKVEAKLKDGIIARGNNLAGIQTHFENMYKPATKVTEIKAARTFLGLTNTDDVEAKAQFLRNQALEFKRRGELKFTERKAEIDTLMGDPPLHDNMNAALKTLLEEKVEVPNEINYEHILDRFFHPEALLARVRGLSNAGDAGEQKVQFVKNQGRKLREISATFIPPRTEEVNAFLGEPPDFLRMDPSLKAKLEQNDTKPLEIHAAFGQMFDPTMDLKAVATARRGLGLDAGNNETDEIGDEDKAQFVSNQIALLRKTAAELVPSRTEEFKQLFDPLGGVALLAGVRNTIVDGNPREAVQEFTDMFDHTKTLLEVKQARGGLGLPHAHPGAEGIGDEDKERFVINQVEELYKLAPGLNPPRTANELKGILGDPPGYLITNEDFKQKILSVRRYHNDPANIGDDFKDMHDAKKSLNEVKSRMSRLGLISNDPLSLADTKKLQDQFINNQIANLTKIATVELNRDPAEIKALFDGPPAFPAIRDEFLRLTPLKIETEFKNMLDGKKKYEEVANAVVNLGFAKADQSRTLVIKRFALNQYAQLQVDLNLPAKYPTLEPGIKTFLLEAKNKDTIIAGFSNYCNTIRRLGPTKYPSTMDKVMEDLILRATTLKDLERRLGYLGVTVPPETLNAALAINKEKREADAKGGFRAATPSEAKFHFEHVKKNYQSYLNRLEYLAQQAEILTVTDKDAKWEQVAKSYGETVSEFKIYLLQYQAELYNVIGGRASMFGRAKTVADARLELDQIGPYLQHSSVGGTKGKIEKIEDNIDSFLASEFKKTQTGYIKTKGTAVEATAGTYDECNLALNAYFAGGAPVHAGALVMGEGSSSLSLSKVAIPVGGDKNSRMIPADVTVKQPSGANPAEVIKTGSLQTVNKAKGEARADIYIQDEASIKKLGQVSKEGWWPNRIPGLAVMEFAAAHIESLRLVAPNPNETIRIIQGKLPGNCVEAFALYCKYKGYNYALPTGFKEVTQEQKDSFAEKWEKRGFKADLSKEQIEKPKDSVPPTIGKTRSS